MRLPNQLLRVAVTLVFLLGNASFTFAQYEFRPANLLTTSGNQLQGKLRFYDWDITPKSVLFIDSLSGQERVLQAEAIRRLVILPDKVFEGKSLAVTTYPTEALMPDVIMAMKPDSGFYLAELLYESSLVKLYRVFDQHKKLHLFLQKNDQLYSLDNIDYQLIRQQSTYHYQRPAYRQTLKEVLTECPTLDLAQLPYSEKAVIDVLNSYHSYCRIDSRIYLEQKKLGNFHIGLGGNYTLFFPTNLVGPADLLGLSLHVQPPRRLHSFFIIADLGIASTRGSETFETKVNAALYGGRYWPLVGDKLFLMGYTGLSMARGPLDTALGLSLLKRFSVVGGISPYRFLFDAGLSPYLNFRLTAPLN